MFTYDNLGLTTKMKNAVMTGNPLAANRNMLQ